jgi:hypothetical protein
MGQVEMLHILECSKVILSLSKVGQSTPVRLYCFNSDHDPDSICRPVHGT